jgi:hypothetical protein
VGQIINALTSRATYAQEDWLVIVSTDHGEHDHPDPERSRIIFHIISGPRRRAGHVAGSHHRGCVRHGADAHGRAIDPAWNLDARVEGFPLPADAYGANLIYNGEPSRIPARTITRRIAALPGGSISAASRSASTAPTRPSPHAASRTAERGNNFLPRRHRQRIDSQRINLADIALDIDSPGVNYTLSGWFGGAGTRRGFCHAYGQLLDAQGPSSAPTSAGAVHARGARQRHRSAATLRQRDRARRNAVRGIRPDVQRRHGNATTPAPTTSLRPRSQSLIPASKILGYGPVTSGWQIEVSSAELPQLLARNARTISRHGRKSLARSQAAVGRSR